MEIYLNHSSLIDATESQVLDSVKEIGAFSRRVRAEQAELRFYDGLWSVPLRSGQTLHQFLYRLPKEEEIKNILLFVDSGPHYSFQGFVDEFSVQPTDHKGHFAEQLLHICFTDHQDLVASLQDEPIMTQPRYFLQTPSDEVILDNLLGEAAILTYFETTRRFRTIQEVFAEIHERSLPNLVIMREAIKSARSHNFLGCFKEVHRALIALAEIELTLVLEETSEPERIRLFREHTGLEISKESPTTLQDDYYLNQRKFKVPGYADKQVFDWHVKIGNHTRIHYFIDKDARKVYVAHCGKHLGIDSYHS